MISVVIPLYNKKECIVNTLNSVLGQSYTDFEVVIVDDGSTDGSTELISTIKDHRIRLITQNNGGPSSARNTGVKYALGDYIAFIDADDIWMPDFLKEMIRLIADFPDAIIYGINYGRIEQGRMICTETKPYRGYLENNWESFPFFFCSSATCCKKSAINKLGGFDARMTYGEDCDMWYRLLLEGKGAIDTQVLAYYNKDTLTSLTKYAYPLEKHIPFYIDKYDKAREENPDFRRFFDEQMVYRLYPYLFIKDYRKQAKLLAKKLDYSLLKSSMRFRMKYPHLYKSIRSIRERAQ